MTHTFCFLRCEGPTSIELDEICNLASLEVDANRVVGLDERVGVTDGAGVMGHQVGDSFGANDDLLHLTQLVLQRKGRPIRKKLGKRKLTVLVGSTSHQELLVYTTFIFKASNSL